MIVQAAVSVTVLEFRLVWVVRLCASGDGREQRMLWRRQKESALGGQFWVACRRLSGQCAICTVCDADGRERLRTGPRPLTEVGLMECAPQTMASSTGIFREGSKNRASSRCGERDKDGLVVEGRARRN